MARKPKTTRTRPFLILHRGGTTEALLQDPTGFALLAVVAMRACRHDTHELRQGDALIGDYLRYGLTRKQYRCAMARLSKAGLATFRGTPQGTVARLTGTDIFDTNLPESDSTQGEPLPENRGQQRANNGANKGANDRAIYDGGASCADNSTYGEQDGVEGQLKGQHEGQGQGPKRATKKNKEIQESKKEVEEGNPDFDHDGETFGWIVRTFNQVARTNRCDTPTFETAAWHAYSRCCLELQTHFSEHRPDDPVPMGRVREVLCGAIRNFGMASGLPHSQAGQWSLPNLLTLEHIKRFVPGVFVLENFDKGQFPGDRPRAEAGRPKDTRAYV